MGIRIFDIAAVDEVARELRIDPHQVRLIRNAFHKRGESFEEAVRLIESDMKREAFVERVTASFLTLESSYDSEIDGATKLILRVNRTGHAIETVVLRNAGGRVSVCVSSQVGCAADCAFCATGKMGLLANLTRDEILDQVIRTNSFLMGDAGERRRIRNVVFMGMGEPFHNTEAVCEAVEVLVSPKCFDLASSRVLVSTVGITNGMLRFANRFPEAGLAVSLHSTNQSVREGLIPIARKYPVGALRECIAEVERVMARPPMIEWLMLRGVNDSEDDADELIAYVRGSKAHINLIPYNAIDGEDEFVASEGKVIGRFAERVRGAGFTVTIRRSLGADIAGACGQLVQKKPPGGVRYGTMG